MEKIDETAKNVTLSFKTTAGEKVALQQIANERHISRSELIASLVYAYKDSYDLIGKTSPKEEQLKLQLKDAEKENRKLNLVFENAEHRIEIEQQSNKKLLKEQMILNKSIFDLQEELKVKTNEISNLLKSLKTNELERSIDLDSGVLLTTISSTIFTGITLLFLPFLFRSN